MGTLYSWTTEMSLAEFAANVQSNSDYTQAGLRFYLQAPLDAALLADIDLSGDPFRLIGDAGAGTADRTFSQAPRMWMSPAGSVSPLHYDLSPSFLTQVRWALRTRTRQRCRWKAEILLLSCGGSCKTVAWRTDSLCADRCACV